MSRALTLFEDQMRSAYALTDPTLLANKSNFERQVFYHAEIAARVAAWDAYLNQIIPEALSRVGDPLNAEVLTLKNLVLLHARSNIDKFNTPNFENSRALFVKCIGFDPIVSWSWPLRAMNWQLVNVRLNEILRIRHSFAHGFPIPGFNWLPIKGTQVYLTRIAVSEVSKLILHLARTTDRDLDAFLKVNYLNVNPQNW